MSRKLSLSSNVILRCEPQYYGTYAAFDYRRVSTESLTEGQYRILEYICRKPSTLDEISKQIEMDYDKCEKFLNRMINLKYVKCTGTSLEAPERVEVNPELFKRFSLPFLSAPVSVDVFITSRCNLKCVHCFSSRDERSTGELSLDDLESIFNQLESMRIFEVRINGGEPVVHRDIDKILLSLKKKRFRKVILTNGTLLNERIVDLLKEAEITPTVSLDDSEAKGHDSFRGAKGAFRQTIKALRLLQRHRVEYGINCCMYKGNLDRCEDITNLAERYGASRIAFLSLQPAGRMKSNLRLVPSYRQYEELMTSLVAVRAAHGRIDVALDVFLHCYPLKESVVEAKKGFVSCRAGKSIMSIDSEGFVYPCNLVISDPNWCMGNAKEEKLLDIWFSQKWDFFRGKVKTGKLQICKGCGKLGRCVDFYCRLLPYVANGNTFGPHPKCD